MSVCEEFWVAVLNGRRGYLGGSCRWELRICVVGVVGGVDDVCDV